MENKHKAIIQGVYEIETWECHHSWYNGIYKVQKWIKTQSEELWSGDLNCPILNKGDKIYISELDVEVTVEEVIRTTFDEYLYKTSHVIDELISDTLEDDRLNAIEKWMSNSFGYDIPFDYLKKFEHEENMTSEELVKMTIKDKWIEIKRILKKKYV